MPSDGTKQGAFTGNGDLPVSLHDLETQLFSTFLINARELS